MQVGDGRLKQFNPGNKFDYGKRRALEHVFCSASSQATFTTTNLLKEAWVAGGSPNCSCGNHQLTSLDPNLQVVWEDRWVRECIEVMYVKRLYRCDIGECATTFCVLGCDVSLLNGLFSLTLLICLPVYCCVFCWNAGVERDKVGGHSGWSSSLAFLPGVPPEEVAAGRWAMHRGCW